MKPLSTLALSLVVLAGLTNGCAKKSDIPTVFETDPSYYQLTEDQVKAREGITVMTRDHVTPRCTNYSYTIQALTDTSMGWVYSKETRQLVSFSNDIRANTKILEENLQILSARYGQATVIEHASRDPRPYYYEWNSQSNEQLRNDGIYKIEVRDFLSHGMLSYRILFVDDDKACARIREQ